jgi:hypothetical protein
LGKRLRGGQLGRYESPALLKVLLMIVIGSSAVFCETDDWLPKKADSNWASGSELDEALEEEVVEAEVPVELVESVDVLLEDEDAWWPP